MACSAVGINKIEPSETMTSDFAKLVTSMPISEWHGQNMVTLDWDDGTTYGVCEFTDPPLSFIFTQIAETRDNSGDINRLYSVFETPTGTVENVNQVIAAYEIGSPELNEALNRIDDEGVETHLLLQSKKEGIFCAYWFRTYL